MKYNISLNNVLVRINVHIFISTYILFQVDGWKQLIQEVCYLIWVFAWLNVLYTYIHCQFNNVSKLLSAVVYPFLKKKIFFCHSMCNARHGSIIVVLGYEYVFQWLAVCCQKIQIFERNLNNIVILT